MQPLHAWKESWNINREPSASSRTAWGVDSEMTWQYFKSLVISIGIVAIFQIVDYNYWNCSSAHRVLQKAFMHIGINPFLYYL